jgi:eukaryotic-like serine/threonine-protein kinase
MSGGEAKQAKDPLELLGKQLLSRYTVLERLAQGGMSVVYRGEDDRLKRPVCVKVFFGLDRSQQLYQTTYEHFVQEAFALSQLQHPNTLRIYDFGYLDEEPRSPFHVSELMDGGTLLGHVRRSGTLPVREVLEILEPIVGALGEAHARGVVHRDIKPSNILFGSAGPTRTVKLADFGIAKATLEDEARAIPNRAQDTNAAAGMRVSLYSPGWASPEQLRSSKVGPTADVYALGLLVAFMLSGRKLFSEKELIKALDQRSAGDDYLREAVRDLALPVGFDQVVLTACRKDPAERPQTAADLLALCKARLREAEQSELSIRTERFDRPDAPRGVERTQVLAALDAPEFLAGSRRVRVLATPPETRDQMELAGANGARFRLTFLPDADRPTRLHVKGLTCFVQKTGARATGALEIDTDTEVELLTPARERMDVVRFAFGVPGGPHRNFHFQEATVVVPLDRAASVALLDFGPGRELVLVYVRRGKV